MSQSPELLLLQKRCYQQLNGNKKMPKDADSVESQCFELKKSIAKKIVLICLGAHQFHPFVHT
jgi:hypothetical protein